MNTQFLVIGENDAGEQASLALLTRRVFKSYEEARQYADEPFRAHRAPQVVECLFPIIENLRPPVN